MMIRLRGEENYLEWRTDIEFVLRINGVWDFASGTAKRPESPVDEESKNREHIAVGECATGWESGALKASVIIYHFLDNEPFERTVGMDPWDPKAILDKLAIVYAEKSLRAQVSRMRQLFNNRMRASESAADFIERQRSLHTEIAAQGWNISEATLSVLTLFGLRSNFDEFVATVSQGDDISPYVRPEKIIAGIREYEDKLNKSSAAALATERSQSPESQQDGNESEQYCHRCKGTHEGLRHFRMNRLEQRRRKKMKKTASKQLNRY